MSRLLRAGCAVLLIASTCVAVPDARQVSSQRGAGRALKIEDYYRIQTIGNASFSPNSKWVTYTVTTRLEEPDTNSNRTDSWLVPSDGSAEPRRVQHEGKDVSNPTWADDGWLQVTADGQRWKIDPDNPSTVPVQIAGAPCGRWPRRTRWTRRGPRRRGRHAQSGRQLGRGRREQAARRSKTGLCERLRKAPPGAVQGRHLRLEGFSARRRGVPGAKSCRAARAAGRRPAAAGVGDDRCAESSRGHGSAPGEPGLASEWPDHRVHRRS